MSDKYFIDKAEEIFCKIKYIEGWGEDSIFTLKDPICNLIYIGLKEVARDQRYACIEDIDKNWMDNKFPENFPYCKVEDLLQNSNINKEKSK